VVQFRVINEIYYTYVLAWNIRKINKQRCGLATNRHGIIIEKRILAKIKSHVIAPAVWRKILKQDASELITILP